MLLLLSDTNQVSTLHHTGLTNLIFIVTQSVPNLAVKLVVPCCLPFLFYLLSFMSRKCMLNVSWYMFGVCVVFLCSSLFALLQCFCFLFHVHLICCAGLEFSCFWCVARELLHQAACLSCACSSLLSWWQYVSLCFLACPFVSLVVTVCHVLLAACCLVRFLLCCWCQISYPPI